MNKTKRHTSWFVIAGLLLLAGPIGARAQSAKGSWQRVYTGEDSVIEFNSSSPRFAPGNILRADFRTVLSKSESISGQPQLKYKTRLETIDFKLNERRYQFFEIALLDSSGKVIQKRVANESDEWRLLKPGGITEKLFDSVCVTTPLGAWRVVDYRFADGVAKGDQATPELDKLIGVNVHLHLDRAEVGDKVCRSPAFQDKDATHDETLRQLGLDWKSLGVRAESVRTINVKCEDSGWQPPQSLLIKDSSSEEMLMLWDGVFLVLKRTDGSGLHRTPEIQTLKRRP